LGAHLGAALQENGLNPRPAYFFQFDKQILIFLPFLSSLDFPAREKPTRLNPFSQIKIPVFIYGGKEMVLFLFIINIR
jgi:hypothetical protein